MKPGSPLRQGLSYAFRMGTEMTVAILIGALMGYALDFFLGSRPWFLATGVLLGGAAGVLNVYRAAMEMQREQEDGGGDDPDDNDNNPDSDADPPDRNHNDFQK